MKHLMKKGLSLALALTMMLSVLATASFTAAAESVIPRPILIQNLTKWKSYTYGGGNLRDTGCGMFSIVNAVGYLTGNEMSITEVASWGHSIGGYNPGSSSDGTYRLTVYPKLQAKYGAAYGFTVDCGSDNQGYWAGASSSTLKNHLKNGGVAIGHVPGHFIAVVGYDSSTGYFHVYDSYPTSARGTGNGDAWVTQSALSTNKLKLDWFCLLTGTGSPINRAYGQTGYTVSFDSRGGSSVASQSVDSGKCATRPANPTRSGYTFVNWYDEDGYVFDFSTKITRNRSLHALWKAEPYALATNFQPTEGATSVNSYSGGSSYVWPFYDASSGFVTMYKGGDEYGWPSMTTTYQKSVDLSANPYLNLIISGNAYFNADLGLRDANGEIYSVKLSQIVKGSDDDFAAAVRTIRADLLSYITRVGLTPAASNRLDIEYITYYVVGELDQFVKIESVDVGPKNASVTVNAMNPSSIAQSGNAAGQYSYNKGVLTMSGADGYTVTFSPNAAFAPKNAGLLLVDVNSTTRFNLSLVVTTSSGDMEMSLGTDFFNQFGCETHPENDAIPDGDYIRALDLLGFYTYNNVLPSSGQSTIKKMTVTLKGDGQLTLKACQASDTSSITYLTDSVVKSDSWGGTISIENDNYKVDNSGVLTGPALGKTVSELKSAVNNGQYVKVYDGNKEMASGDLVKTGCVVKVVSGGSVIATYTLAVPGDVNGSGTLTSADARDVVLSSTFAKTLSAAAKKAADYDGNGSVNTADARRMVASLIG
ncbi:MAG: InlB B-repeat-containing protein [Clostridia bacterium]|nr:InlB B-repeat-containing protein [Clostridia bacterium]